MSELPLSSKYRDRAGEAVDEDERADLADRLADQFTRGSLTQDDYLVRLDLLYRAEKLGDLVEVIEGLPPRVTHNVPAIAQQSGTPGLIDQAKGLPMNTVMALGGLILLAVVAVIMLVFLSF